jgi:hypothetical protein
MFLGASHQANNINVATESEATNAENIIKGKCVYNIHSFILVVINIYDN